MRKYLFLLLGAALLGACSEDPAGPDDASPSQLEAELAASLGDFGGPRLGALPDSLKPTAEQQVALRAALEAHRAAVAADHEAIRAIRQEAAEARRAGNSRDEVAAILEKARPIHERLRAADAALKAKIDSILTDAQKAWLAARQDRREACSGFALTAEQRSRIESLTRAFAESRRADLETLKSIHDRAAAARRSGASRDDVARILDEGRAIAERLRAAHEALQAEIDAVFTAEQKASGCFDRSERRGRGNGRPAPGPMPRRP